MREEADVEVLIKSVENVTDVSVRTVLAATLRIWKNLCIQRWKREVQGRR